jgi:hypothetical protein
MCVKIKVNKEHLNDFLLKGAQNKDVVHLQL